MYQLFIGNKNYSSWSLRPWILLKQLEIPFEETLVPFDEGSSWSKFRAFAPTGLVPCLVDGETTVWDSLAIAEYLAEDHHRVWPAGKAARAWARCASAEMHSGFSTLRQHCPMNCGVRVTLNEVPDGLKRDLARIDELWSEGLQRFGGPFLAGDSFTAVDAFFAPVVFRVLGFSLPLSGLAQEYVQRVRQLPAMQAWFDDAIAEPWREQHHEEEILEVGKVLEDLRGTPA